MVFEGPFEEGIPGLQSTSTTTTMEPVVGVSRSRLNLADSHHYGRSGAAFGGGAGLFPSQYQPRQQGGAAPNHLMSIFSVAFIGSALLLALGCVLFQYCRGKLRSHPPDHRQEEEGGAATAAAAAQASVVTPPRAATTVDEREVESVPVPARVPYASDGEASSDNELSHLTASCRNGEPIRYCIIPATEGQSAEGANGSLQVSSPAENPSHRLSSPRHQLLPGSGSYRRSDPAPNDEIQSRPHTMAYNGDLPWSNSNGTRTHETIVTRRDDYKNNDDEFDVIDLTDGKALTPSLPIHSDNNNNHHQGAVMVNDVDSSPPTSSDMSEYLSTLVLDVSSDRERSRSVASDAVSQEDDSCSLPSDESFSRLQDIKAQAEFSPYHIAWSTPHLARHRIQSDRSELSVRKSVAKKLDVDFGKPNPNSFPQWAEAEAAQEYNGRSPIDRPLQGVWPLVETGGSRTLNHRPVCRHGGPLRPEDALCRPLSADYRTPRPATHARRRDSSKGDHSNADSLDRERQPLLPYSVTEYRKSLKSSANDVASDAGTVAESRGDLHTDNDSSSSYPSSSASHSESPDTVTAQNAARKVPSIRIDDWDATDRTPGNSRQDLCCDNLDNTLADVGDFNQSGEEVWGSCTPYAVSDGEARDANAKTSPDVRDGHGDVSDSSDSPLSGTGSSAPLSTPSPSYAASSEATSSSEKSGVSSGDDLLVSKKNQCKKPRNISSHSTAARHLETDFIITTNTAIRSPSPERLHSRLLERDDNFKVPFPVDNFRTKSAALTSTGDLPASSQPGMPRSKSSTGKPLSHLAVSTVDSNPLPAIRRSRTAESLGPSERDLTGAGAAQLMSISSWSDVSVAGSSASRTSLQDLVWDSEFTASGRHNESLTWDNDPYLD